MSLGYKSPGTYISVVALMSTDFTAPSSMTSKLAHSFILAAMQK